MIVRASRDRIELVRNLAFHEWSGAAQPDGFVDAISWRLNQDVASSFDRLSAGELDLMTDAPQPEDLASLQAAHPDQVVSWELPLTLYVGMDVLNPPFDDLLVRQALNYAIDRDHVVELAGGPASWHATCQILPPNFHGYEPFCPYTLDPDAGVWSAPDPDRARALIEDADAIGEKVTVWVNDDPGVGLYPPEQGSRSRGTFVTS
jgi:peptide/nickel transport system substrate-binding protein